MIICSCNVFSDHEVRTAVAVGAPPRTTGELFRYLGCSAQCGRCAWSIKAIMDAHAGVVDLAQRVQSDLLGQPRGFDCRPTGGVQHGGVNRTILVTAGEKIISPPVQAIRSSSAPR
jgi:bacterioferritin-associated ferredoxin